MGLTEFLAEYITRFMEQAGYIVVFILMTMESMVLPVPSEAVMPFAGFLIAEKKFTWFFVILFSILGSIVGSLISYIIGKYGGKPFVNKFGKYLLLNNHHLEITEKFFNKYGDITILICRFIPIVRHLISIPAGIGKMNIFKFSIFTIIGAGIWNFTLAYIGFILRSNWDIVIKYLKIVDIVIIIGIIFLIGFFIYKQIKNKKDKIVN